jgi:hypothetical protein
MITISDEEMADIRHMAKTKQLTPSGMALLRELDVRDGASNGRVALYFDDEQWTFIAQCLDAVCRGRALPTISGPRWREDHFLGLADTIREATR